MNDYEYALKIVDDERLATEINGEMDKHRPKYADFADIYSDAEMTRDKERLEKYRQDRGIDPDKERKQLKDGLLVEKMFLGAEDNDIFLEFELYDELLTDDGDFLLWVFPAHEYDDVFNNADLICLVRNELTDHKAVPFVVDCTSNASKVYEKANYERTEEGITGFTEVKYFKDKASMTDALPAGRLAKVPRFIVGFDANLAREILTANNNEWTRKDLKEKFETIGYCLLKELSSQAKGGELEKYFDRLLSHFEETRKEEVAIFPGDDVLSAVLGLEPEEVQIDKAS